MLNNKINVSPKDDHNIVNEEKLSKFNFESIITIEEILTYFFNDEIKFTKNNFINYYKIIYYYIITKSTSEIFPSKSSFSKSIERLFNLQFISILLEGIYLINPKNNNKDILKIVKDCISKNHQNFLFLSQILINELQYKNMTNIFSNKIYKIILEKLNDKDKNKYNIKEVFLKIDKNNKEIENQIKQIINSKKIISTPPKGISPLSGILDSLDKKSSSNTNTIDYCLKYLEVKENDINEIKNKNYLNSDDEDNSSLLYPCVKVPFLPIEKNNNYVLTVVLDLDETLIGFEKEENEDNEDEEYEEEEDIKNMILRPGLYEFLDGLTKLNCELVLFTSSNKNYADNYINEIEKSKKYFKKRLYRENCVLMGSAYVKDLSKLGRDLSKVIIVDNDYACFYLQQENGILIKPFLGNKDEKDMTLNNLLDILSNIIKNKFQDIRIDLEKYENEIKNKVTNK